MRAESQSSPRFLQERESWFRFGEYRMRYLHLPAAAPASPPLPAVVFVHGLMGYSFSWRHNLDFFARHRDVYAIDLLGIGHSDRPATGTAEFSLAAAASRLLDFIRTLGHSQIDLVGTSHGGAIAMLAASQDRASPAPLIRRLVLVAPAHPFMTDARLRLAFFRTSLGRKLLRGLAFFGWALRGQAMGRMYADPSRITPETRAGYAINLDDPRSYDYALEVVRSWRRDMQQLQAALPSIAMIPVLLLWGEEDQAVSPSSGLLLRRCFRHAEYVVLPHAGHLPYEEVPEEFNRSVLHFLDS
jgi:pimeloyl-ACP methyl ester carboxylesterase